MTLYSVQDLLQRLLRSIDIQLPRFLSFLLERIQDMDDIRSPCHVNHPELWRRLEDYPWSTFMARCGLVQEPPVSPLLPLGAG